MTTPLVSICCITYNHAPFIRQCLDGFLMQKLQAPSSSKAPSNSPKGGETDFNSVPSGEGQEGADRSSFGEGREGAEWSFEILIHDDCSTDGTTEIVKEYAAKYPDLIFPLYETENQYSKPGRESMDFYNYRRARGKYIAYCEGDDYWTDPLKLQKQVEFMEAHPEYSLCVHGVEVNDLRKGKSYIPNYELGKDDDGIDVTSALYFTSEYIQPLAIVFRKSMFSFEWAKQYHGYRDAHEIYHLLQVGKGRFLNFIGGVYVRHNGGVNSGINTLQSCREVHEYITDIYQHNRRDKDLQKYLTKALLWILEEYHKREMKSLYWTTVKDILRDTPELFFYVMWIQLKRAIKNKFRL